MPILHLTLSYPCPPDTQRRIAVAESTWGCQPWAADVLLRVEGFRRVWREEGKALGYVRDIFDAACHGWEDSDIILYTNPDDCVATNCAIKVAAMIQTSNACYAFRRDFPRLDGPIPDDRIPTGSLYPGSDLAAFRVGWWREFLEQMPDMILGFEAWDPCFRTLAETTTGAASLAVPEVIYHEAHASWWMDAANRYRLLGQKYNLKLAAAFLRKHGVDPRRHGIMA